MAIGKWLVCWKWFIEKIYFNQYKRWKREAVQLSKVYIHIRIHMYLQQANICHRIGKYRLKNVVIYFWLFIFYTFFCICQHVSHLRVCVCVCEYFTGLSKHLLSISIFFEMLLSWIKWWNWARIVCCRWFYRVHGKSHGP